MTTQERDKFLTEAMGLCWHDSVTNETCDNCGITADVNMPNYVPPFQGKWLRIDFSTWAGFGALWEWAQKQEWWDEFMIHSKFTYSYESAETLINPTVLSYAVYEYLKGRESK